jgi:6-pyruvoyltetrahydropterin/6-carboxytetrahydropterin synthase
LQVGALAPESRPMVHIQRPVVELTRAVTFSACHALRAGKLSPEENERLFGPCARRHGHNYVLEVTVRGPVDAQTGMVLDMRLLKEVIEKHVLEKLDHASIDEDVNEFASENGGYAHALPATTENLAAVIWGWLEPHLGLLLYRIRLWETEKNVVTFYGEYEAERGASLRSSPAEHLARNGRHH